ncbi:MAG: HAMP domain-containing histidine kinase [Methylococcales bacterium]|jgi:signal transduction histidine kinase|nr:HAMP domain-containing histidine kinase [Methylococcales bacterium]MBT7443172.1 HAMP domain-containing histidine kinase [Methylococcales bacterium]
MAEEVASDWAQSWQASLPIKITSIVLWGIAIVGLVLSAVLLWGGDDKLKDNFDASSDRIAFAVQNLLIQSKEFPRERIKALLAKRLAQYKIDAVNVKVDGKSKYKLGDIDNKDKWIDRKFTVLYIGSTARSDVHIMLYHPSVEKLFRSEQKHLLWTMVVVCMLFGLMLSWAMHRVVTAPFDALVKGSQKISGGDLKYRFNASRSDEFGYLGGFFNQMMDQLSVQQDELKDALLKAESSTQAKSNFLASMSHELRTPLNAIIGYSEMLMDDTQEGEQVYYDLGKICSSGLHLLGLIDDILDLSKVEAGKVEFKLEDTDIFELIKSTVSIIKPVVNKNQNTFELDCDNSVGSMVTDGQRLKQILFNLLSNAAKFSKQSKMGLRVKRILLDEIQFIQFVVWDTGIGMNEEQQRAVFQPFAQATLDIGRHYGGTGLGLAITQTFCEILGGYIEVQSELGKGSSFYVYMPVKCYIDESYLEGQYQSENSQYFDVSRRGA